MWEGGGGGAECALAPKVQMSRFVMHQGALAKPQSVSEASHYRPGDVHASCLSGMASLSRSPQGSPHTVP